MHIAVTLAYDSSMSAELRPPVLVEQAVGSLYSTTAEYIEHIEAEDAFSSEISHKEASLRTAQQFYATLTRQPGELPESLAEAFALGQMVAEGTSDFNGTFRLPGDIDERSAPQENGGEILKAMLDEFFEKHPYVDLLISSSMKTFETDAQEDGTTLHRYMAGCALLLADISIIVGYKDQQIAAMERQFET